MSNVAPPADTVGRGSNNGSAPEGACGFTQAPIAFALPVIPGLPSGSFHAATGAATCFNGNTFRYDLRDVDGDQQPDLVVSSACDDASIGVTAWRVYVNTGAGFSPDPIRFALPLPRPASCTKEIFVDVDGDLKPDVVRTSLCNDASVGTTRWIVFRNNGAGFDAASDFALPPGVPPGSFSAPSVKEASCLAGRPAFESFDIDGDRKLDLVVTRACDDNLVGTTAWRVHRGTGAGFEATPTTYPLPAGPALPHAYTDATGSTADCGASPLSRSYAVVDFDGDFAPDIVFTRLCNDVSVGSTHWLAHRNLGNGFAEAPASVPLPRVASPLGAFPGLAGEAACASRRPGYAAIDVTGDFRRDLLVTRVCEDPTSGVSHWFLYRNDAGAIAPEPVAFELPRVLGGSTSAPLGLAAAAACTAAPRPAFFTTSLVARKFDLVVTRACNDATVGATKWLLYEAGCQ